MSNNNGNSLLNFLQQNSLFTSSPKKNGLRKSKSRSKDRTQSNKTPNKPNNDDPYKNKISSQPLDFSYNNTLQSNRGFNPQNNSFAPPPSSTILPSHNNTFSLERGSFAPDKTYAPQKNNFTNAPQKTSFKLGNGLHEGGRFETFEPLESNKFEKHNENRGITQPKQNNQLWTGLVSHSTSFESARIESSQCLQNLGSKLRNQISTINMKIDSFNTKMYRVIADQFKGLRERIFFVIEESFKESEKYIREYMKSQQQKLAGDLIKMRETLQKEYGLVEGMKEEIAKTNWRKVAGQIIASQLQRKVDQMVKHSAGLNVGRWQLGDLVGYRLKDLQRDLREVVRLKREP